MFLSLFGVADPSQPFANFMNPLTVI